ncbi:MAG: ATP-binding protein [Christensenellaceae bacterium]|jgi:DNA replication protein DnaC|nr:ATP-binding protein [Christensenellaceae bacterium]
MNIFQRNAAANLAEKRQQKRDSAQKKFDILTKDAAYSSTRAELFDAVLAARAPSDIEKINKKLSQRVAKLGFSNEELQERNYCKKCQDSGTLFSDGKAVQCGCVKTAIAEAAYGASMTPDTAENSFRGFITEQLISERPELDLTYRMLSSFVEMLDGKGRTPLNYFTVMGATGTGKTLAVSVFFNKLKAEGVFSYFISAATLAQTFSRSVSTYNAAEIADIMSELTSPEVLIVDDLGAETFFDNVTRPKMQEIIEARKEKLTVITTNLSPKQLETRYGERFISRVFDTKKGGKVRLSGADFRLER